MRLDEYIKQEQSIRGGIHFKNGVWWRQTTIGRCHPLYPMQRIILGDASPKYSKSFFGYWYLVNDIDKANSQRSFMMLSKEKLKTFCYEGLSHEKRKAINKASRNGIVVKKIFQLEDHWKSMQAVFKSTARRTQYGLPEEYYTEKEEEWKMRLRVEFALPNRDWFGVWKGQELLGYLYSCLIDDMAFLLVTKFNSDFLDLRPSDALHYHILEYYRDQPDCYMVTAGENNPMVSSIDRFKKGYGFEVVNYPSVSIVNRVAKNVIRVVLDSATLVVKERTDSKRNLRYQLETMRNSLNNW